MKIAKKENGLVFFLENGVKVEVKENGLMSKYSGDEDGLSFLEEINDDQYTDGVKKHTVKVNGESYPYPSLIKSENLSKNSAELTTDVFVYDNQASLVFSENTWTSQETGAFKVERQLYNPDGSDLIKVVFSDGGFSGHSMAAKKSMTIIDGSGEELILINYSSASEILGDESSVDLSENLLGLNGKEFDVVINALRSEGVDCNCKDVKSLFDFLKEKSYQNNVGSKNISNVLNVPNRKIHKSGVAGIH